MGRPRARCACLDRGQERTKLGFTLRRRALPTAQQGRSTASGIFRQSIVPTFVCRRAQYSTFKMAKDLGFHVIATKVQPIVWGDTTTLVCSMRFRTQLACSDLFPEAGAHPMSSASSKPLSRARHRNCREVGVRWSQPAPPLPGSKTVNLRSPLAPRSVEQFETSC